MPDGSTEGRDVPGETAATPGEVDENGLPVVGQDMYLPSDPQHPPDLRPYLLSVRQAAYRMADALGIPADLIRPPAAEPDEVALIERVLDAAITTAVEHRMAEDRADPDLTRRLDELSAAVAELEAVRGARYRERLADIAAAAEAEPDDTPTVHGSSGGVALTDEVIERAAAEAEAGYPPERLRSHSYRHIPRPGVIASYLAEASSYRWREGEPVRIVHTDRTETLVRALMETVRPGTALVLHDGGHEVDLRGAVLATLTEALAELAVRRGPVTVTLNQTTADALAAGSVVVALADGDGDGTVVNLRLTGVDLPPDNSNRQS